MFSQGRGNVLVARFDTCFIYFLSQRGRCPSHARGFTSASLLNDAEKAIITGSACHPRRAASIRYTEVGRSPRDRRPNSSPYGNATSTVKNRNAGSPPSGTSLHPSDNFALPFVLMRGVNELPTPSVEWLNSNFGLPPST